MSATADGRLTLVPQLALELTAAPGNQHHLIDGSMLSADISGFTALSERLADKGKAGAEEITALINKCFDELIGTAYRYGGEVLKFGGDAILVIFRGAEHERRSIAAAVAMQEALHSSRAAKKAKLTMTVGVAEGPFDVFMSGTEHRDLLITGENASKVIELEAGADKGHTLISEHLASLVADEVDLTPHELGFDIATVIDAPELGPVDAKGDVDLLGGLIAPAINDHFAAFAQLGGEHRIVAVNFVSVTGFHDLLVRYGGDEVANLLGEFVDTINEITARYDVSILHSDIYDDGVKFLMCAGAPLSTGQSTDSILRAALDIQSIESQFVIKQGIQQGRCFAGFLGSEYRRAYTLMGDIVNTAARMLGPAHDRDVVVVDDAFKTTRSIFLADPIDPVQAKGKAQPIPASLLLDVTAETRVQKTGASLVGRDKELALFDDVLDEGTHTVVLRGPAGAGKSRLLQAFLDRAAELERDVFHSGCSPYSRAVPFASLRLLLRGVLGLGQFDTPDVAGAALLEAIETHAPELASMAPLAAIPIGADVPATTEADAIDEKFRRPAINRVVADLLGAILADEALLVIEDVHWIDEPSAEFFSHLLGTPEFSRTMVVTTRPEQEWIPEQTTALIQIEPLTADDIRQLALESSDHRLTDRQVDTVVEQSQGNPLFTIELARALASSDGEAVPETVEKLIGARIDALEPSVRHAIRVASVFGYRLRLDDLQVVLAPEPPPDLDQLSDFVSVDEVGNLGFTHALYREVSYEGLPYRERRRLHGHVGTHLETVTADPNTIADVLALHFFEAKDSARAWNYGVVAGDAAKAKTATAEAAESYKRALSVAGNIRDLPATEVGRVALALGDAAALVSDFGAAESAFVKVRRLNVPDADKLTAMLRIGRLREGQTRFSDALRWYTRVEQDLQSLSDSEEMLIIRSEMHHQRSGILHRRGDHQGCIVEARLALGTAEDADDLERMAHALHRLHLATVYLRRPDRIGYGPRALQFFRELGDFERQASVLNNLGIEHYFAGRWSDAAANYRDASTAGLRAGSTVDGMLGALNSGEILSDQGHWEEAIDLLHSARRNWEDGRYPMGAAMAYLYLGTAFDRSGELESARSYLAQARDALAELGLPDESLDAELRLAESHLLHDGSTTELESVLQRLSDDHALRPKANRLIALSGLEPVDVCVERLADDLDSLTGYERALTLRVLGVLAADDNPGALEEASEIFESLGVIQLRPLPSTP